MPTPMNVDPNDPNLYTGTVQAPLVSGTNPPCALTKQLKVTVNTATGYVNVNAEGPISSGTVTSSNTGTSRSGIPPDPQGPPLQDPNPQEQEGTGTGLTVSTETGNVGGISIAITQAKGAAGFTKDPNTGANNGTRDTSYTVTVTICSPAGCCYRVIINGGFNYLGNNSPPQPTTTP